MAINAWSLKMRSQKMKQSIKKEKCESMIDQKKLLPHEETCNIREEVSYWSDTVSYWNCLQTYLDSFWGRSDQFHKRPEHRDCAHWTCSWTCLFDQSAMHVLCELDFVSLVRAKWYSEVRFILLFVVSWLYHFFVRLGAFLAEQQHGIIVWAKLLG